MVSFSLLCLLGMNTVVKKPITPTKLRGIAITYNLPVAAIAAGSDSELFSKAEVRTHKSDVNYMAESEELLELFEWWLLVL